MINIIAQYTRAIINTGLSLYTVRLVLKILGQADYGIWSIVGGIIMFLGFITNAMIITTQRHLSFDYGNKPACEVRRTFSNSICLHIVIGLSLLAALLLLESLIISPSFLNIATSRWAAAHDVYKVVSLILLTTFITAPFKALLIARENIVFISCVEILDGMVKLLLVLLLPYIPADKLVVYGFMLLAIMIMELVVFSVYDIVNYQECSPRHFLSDVNRSSLHRLSSFAGWTTYGMVVIVGRNQGIAWLINHFFGTIINASYGIANQLSTAVQFIGSSIANAMNPQIMKSEGKGDRQHMLHMSEQESKMIVTMLSIVFVPIMVEIQSILNWWLVDTPRYTALFCDALLAAYLIDQLTSGLNAANQAIGNIRNYTLIMYTPKLFLIVAAFFLLHFGYGIETIMLLYVVVELVVALARLPYLHFTAGLDTRSFVRNVILRNALLIAFTATVSLLLSCAIDFRLKFFLTLPVDMILASAFAWLVIFNRSERQRLSGILMNLLKKHN
jgi:O-antigen/teichoic acid export membrane protein